MLYKYILDTPGTWFENSNALSEKGNKQHGYVSVGKLLGWEMFVCETYALNATLCFLRMLKYLEHQTGTKTALVTLYKSVSRFCTMLWVSVLQVVLFLLAGNIGFGPQSVMYVSLGIICVAKGHGHYMRQKCSLYVCKLCYFIWTLSSHLPHPCSLSISVCSLPSLLAWTHALRFVSSSCPFDVVARSLRSVYILARAVGAGTPTLSSRSTRC